MSMTTITAASEFVHVFEPATGPSRPPLLLLHGMGGDERDLLPLGRMVASGAALLSSRGGVLENGMPRFFRRLAEGVFDEDDLRRRTNDLAAFFQASRARYGIEALVALGFFNGANTAAALLLRHPGVLNGAALPLRAMVPFRQLPRASLPGMRVLLLSGAVDPIVPAANSRTPADILRQSGAVVDHRELPGGHGLTQADADDVARWLSPSG